MLVFFLEKNESQTPNPNFLSINFGSIEIIFWGRYWAIDTYLLMEDFLKQAVTPYPMRNFTGGEKSGYICFHPKNLLTCFTLHCPGVFGKYEKYSSIYCQHFLIFVNFIDNAQLC